MWGGQHLSPDLYIQVYSIVTLLPGLQHLIYVHTSKKPGKNRKQLQRGRKRMHSEDVVFKCGGHLQWINTADRSGSLCLECAIGTHSWPVETEAWSRDCLRSLVLDKQHRRGTGGLPAPEGLAPSGQVKELQVTSPLLMMVVWRLQKRPNSSTRAAVGRRLLQLLNICQLLFLHFKFGFGCKRKTQDYIR